METQSGPLPSLFRLFLTRTANPVPPKMFSYRRDKNEHPSIDTSAMKSKLYSLRQVAAALGLKPYKITYCLTAGHVPEPLTVGNRRLFSTKDVVRLAEHFDVNIDQILLLENNNDV